MKPAEESPALEIQQLDQSPSMNKYRNLHQVRFKKKNSRHVLSVMILNYVLSLTRIFQDSLKIFQFNLKIF